MVNSVDPDQTPRSVVSDLGLLYLPIPVCPNNQGKYGKFDNFFISSAIQNRGRVSIFRYR